MTSNLAISILHIAIDFQDDFVDWLDLPYSDEFCKGANTFISTIRPRIPTIKIVYGLKFKIHAGSITKRKKSANKKLGHKYGISKFITVRRKDDIISKESDNLFEHPKVIPYIKKNYPTVETLVFTGIETSFCVAETIAGALSKGFKCVAIIDLLADHLSPEGNDPKWQIATLLNSVQKYLEQMHPNTPVDELMQKLSYMTAAEFIQGQKENPAPPIEAGPGLTLEKRGCG